MKNRIDITKIKTYPLKTRESKVNIKDFVFPYKPSSHKNRFDDIIPPVLAGNNFKTLINSIISAREKDKPVIFMHGAHVIKCGLSLLVIDLMKKGFITTITSNGASVVHDFEIAYNGATSEDVATNLVTGKFGMAKETGEKINNWIKLGAKNNIGLGEVIGKSIQNESFKYKNYSIFANAYKLNIISTVHVAIGTDIIYQHPDCDASSWGKTSYTDFLKLTEVVSNLNNGGVVLNFGSAVILPEVFLKVLNLARNLGHKVEKFTTANFDMIDQYRPRVNIIERPTLGKGYMFIGHHEIMLPLLYSCLVK